MTEVSASLVLRFVVRSPRQSCISKGFISYWLLIDTKILIRPPSIYCKKYLRQIPFWNTIETFSVHSTQELDFEFRIVTTDIRELRVKVQGAWVQVEIQNGKWRLWSYSSWQLFISMHSNCMAAIFSSSDKRLEATVSEQQKTEIRQMYRSALR